MLSHSWLHGCPDGPVGRFLAFQEHKPNVLSIFFLLLFRLPRQAEQRSANILRALAAVGERAKVESVSTVTKNRTVWLHSYKVSGQYSEPRVQPLTELFGGK